MSGQGYDNALRETYSFLAAAVDAAAIFGRFIGPAGKTGRVVNITAVVTVTTTDAAAEIAVDTVAGLTTTPILDVPVTVANLGVSAIPGNVTDGLALASDLPADTICTVESDGGATAGDANIIVTVDWF